MNKMTSRRTRLAYRLLSAFIAFTFSFTSVIPPSYAQSIASLNLPMPGTMVTPSAAFVPVLLKGMTIHPDNPLQFDFIIDSGNTNFKEDRIETESQRLVKYFLASMTIPKDDLWVNLSPYEKDRIIPDELGKTELGRDMLAQDYILKQLTASLMYPEKELGKEFWDKVYQKAKEKYGTTEIPVDTFNKVWILPETATVYEHGQTVYIVEAKLRVMLDADYLAMSHQSSDVSHQKKTESQNLTTEDRRLTTQVVREVILPAIEKEVNEGQNFAPLRQIYHSLILAKWYKETIKNSLLSKVYVDKKLINGIRLEDGQLKREDGSIIDSQSSIVDQIYNQYMEAYKKGVFNYIKEDYDRLSNEMIPRKYFSGGEELTKIALERSSNPVKDSSNPQYQMRVEVTPQKQGASSPIFKNLRIRIYIALLDSDSPFDKIRGIKGLTKIGDARALPALKTFWEAEEPGSLRRTAYEAINGIISRTENGKLSSEESKTTFSIPERLKEKAKRRTIYVLGIALHEASIVGDIAEVTKILEINRISVDIRYLNGYTPLMAAAASGQTEVVKELLRHGSDVNLFSDFNKTAIDLATNDEIIQLLKEAGGKKGEDLSKEGAISSKLVQELMLIIDDVSLKNELVPARAWEILGRLERLNDKYVIEALKTLAGISRYRKIESGYWYSRVLMVLAQKTIETKKTAPDSPAQSSPSDTPHSSSPVKPIVHTLSGFSLMVVSIAAYFILPPLLGGMPFFLQVLVFGGVLPVALLIGSAWFLFSFGNYETYDYPGNSHTRIEFQDGSYVDVTKGSEEEYRYKNHTAAVDYVEKNESGREKTALDSPDQSSSPISKEIRQIENKISAINDAMNVLRDTLTKTSERILVGTSRSQKRGSMFEGLANDDTVPNPDYIELEGQINGLSDQKGNLILQLSKLQAEKLALNRIIAKLSDSARIDLIRGIHVEKVVALGNDNFDVVYHPGMRPIPINVINKTSYGDVVIYDYADGVDISVPAGSDAPGRWNDKGAEHIEIIPKAQSSSPVVEQQGQGIASDKIRDTSDEEVGGIDMNSIDLDRQGAGVDIQFDAAELQELIDAGIDGFAPVIINITPLPSVLPLLGLEPQRKEEALEVSSLN